MTKRSERAFLAEAFMPSPPLGESWQDDKARQSTVGARPPGTNPRPTLTYTVSVQLLLVRSWPVAHLPSPSVLQATCERRGCPPPGLSLPPLLRVWLDWTWGGHPREDLDRYKPPQRGSCCGRGQQWRPRMANNRESRLMSEEREIFRIG